MKSDFVPNLFIPRHSNHRCKWSILYFSIALCINVARTHLSVSTKQRRPIHSKPFRPSLSARGFPIVTLKGAGQSARTEPIIMTSLANSLIRISRLKTQFAVIIFEAKHEGDRTNVNIPRYDVNNVTRSRSTQ